MRGIQWCVSAEVLVDLLFQTEIISNKTKQVLKALGQEKLNFGTVMQAWIVTDYKV